MNRSFHIGSLLTLLCVGVMSGHRDMASIVRLTQTLTQKQRIMLGLPKYENDSNYRKTPSYSAFRNLLIKLNPDAFAEVLSEWLRANEGTLPRQLALDGKFVGKTVGLVSLSDASTGIPVAMGAASEKSEKSTRIVQSYCGLAPSFFVSIKLIEKAHGRIEERQSWIHRLEDPAEVGLAHVFTLIVTQRHTINIKTGKKSSDTAPHLSTEDIESRPANQWAKMIADHSGLSEASHSRAPWGGASVTCPSGDEQTFVPPSACKMRRMNIRKLRTTIYSLSSSVESYA